MNRNKVKKAIEVLEEVGVKAVFTQRNGNIEGKYNILNKIFKRSRRQKLMDKRAEIDKKLEEIG